MLKNDQISSIFFFFIGLVIIAFSIPYELGSLHSPKTGFLPFVTGMALCILSLVGFLAAMMKIKHEGKWKSIFKGFQWKKPLITMGALIAYAFSLNILGYILSTTILVAFLLRAIIPQKWAVVITGAILTPSITYFIFRVLLKTELPSGFIKY